MNRAKCATACALRSYHRNLFADVPVEIVAVRDNCQADTATATVENGRIFVIKEDKLWGGRYEALLYLLGPQNGL